MGLGDLKRIGRAFAEAVLDRPPLIAAKFFPDFLNSNSTTSFATANDIRSDIHPDGVSSRHLLLPIDNPLKSGES
jgi:hypothetical protein